MDSGGHFFWWASRILAVVCLLLLALNLLLPSGEENNQPIPELAVAEPEPAVAAVGAYSPGRDRRGGYGVREPRPVPEAKRRGGLAPAFESGGEPPHSKIGASFLRQDRRRTPLKRDSVGGETPPLQVASLPEAPATKTLKPLGYVEKADGEVTAVIADGEYIRLVREGDLLAEGLRVVRISPRLVEAVEELPQRAAISVLPRRNSEPAEPPGRKPTTAPLLEAVATTSLAEILPRHVEGLKSQGKGAPPRRALPDRHPSETKTKAVVTPPLTAAIEARAAAPPSPVLKTLKPIGYVERADGRVEAVVEDEDRVYLAREGEVFADRYRAIKVSRSSVQVVENLGPPAWQSPLAEVGIGAAQRPASEPLVTASHSPPEERTILDRQREESPGLGLVAFREGTSPPRSPPRTTLATLGYVERGNGEVEAIVADEGEVYLVREGEVFAEKYLALSVSRSSVEVVENSPRDFVQATMFGPESGGGVRTSKPRAANSHSPPAAGVVERAAAPLRDESAAPAASGDEIVVSTGSPPTPLEPLGYVEWADGRIGAIILDEDQVYVVQEGEVFAGNRQAIRVSRSSAEVVENLGPPSKVQPLEAAGLREGKRPASESLFSASHSPPGAGLDPSVSQEVTVQVSQTAPSWVYLLTEHRGSRFDFDMHVRLPDNRSE